MSFSFNFVSNTENSPSLADTGSPVDSVRVTEIDQTEKSNASFEWIQDEIARSSHQHFLQNQNLMSESIDLSCSDPHYILRVQEKSSSFQNRNTDLVPGVYEGGLKVWECSIDLCRYFLRENIVIKGHVLELGCGHGLPGICVLKQAIANRSHQMPLNCFVTFSDYNEFVIKDVTIPNVAINVRNACFSGNDGTNKTDEMNYLLENNIAYGSGDWMAMSDLLLGNKGACVSSAQPMHPALPIDGLFDCILASETTYSENAANETAELLSRHLKPGTGVAYICTKRYYFGVGGGTKCLCDSLREKKTHKFHIETLDVYDNGVGNIRELLLVKSLGFVD